MANIIDYVQWRGDITFQQSPFNYVDALILSQISYFLFNEEINNMTLRDAAAQLFATKQKVTEGLLVSQEDSKLLSLLARSRRFGHMILSGYVDKVDEEEEKQFAAITIYPGDGTTFISYRGTDDTLIGWKEDLNMSFIVPVPSQLEAVQYLENVARRTRGRIRVGGHSKGGNLAVYASAFCDRRIQRRIIEIYNNDGPGFSSQIIESVGYQLIRNRIHAFVPQSSVVGMLLGHEDTYRVVHSVQTGLFQHDPYSWEVLATDFTYLDYTDKESRFADMTLKEWVMGMNNEDKRNFVNTLYEVIKGTQANTLTDLSIDGIQTAKAVIKTMSSMDSETKKMFSKIFSQLMKIVRKNLVALKRIEKQSRNNGRRTLDEN